MGDTNVITNALESITNVTNIVSKGILFNVNGGFEYWVWASFGTLLLVLEIFAPGFVFFWFGVGAIFTSILVLILLKTLEVQILAWLIISFSLAFLYFQTKRKKEIKEKSTDPVFRYIGYRGEVIQEIHGNKMGRVRLDLPINGILEWSAITTNPEEKIEIGSRVSVEGIDGIKLIVKKIS